MPTTFALAPARTSGTAGTRLLPLRLPARARAVAVARATPKEASR